ncbi:unnamed protein product [Blepharisma stoltei]|uniref:Uncharacterized protein n=1 Tax=Blepharisma stoltei TaxID=1481888 RepID=A0AAU9JJR0_9CILI|nr:unnamed protein product [Blepharisma stoltei]
METGLKKRAVPKISFVSAPTSPKLFYRTVESGSKTLPKGSNKITHHLLRPGLLSQGRKRSTTITAKPLANSYRPTSQDSTGCYTVSSTTSFPCKFRFSELSKIQSQPNFHPGSQNRLQGIDHILSEIEKEKSNNLKPYYDNGKVFFQKLGNELKESVNLVYDEMMAKKRKRYKRSLYIKVEPNEVLTTEGLKKLRKQLRFDMKRVNK